MSDGVFSAEGSPLIERAQKELAKTGQAPGCSAAHPGVHYRCFLPNLAGFADPNCTEPET